MGGGRVIGIVGRMGSGKSLQGVRLAVESLERGRNVRSNFNLQFTRPDGAPTRIEPYRSQWDYFEGWEQFLELEECDVFIDEAQEYAPSYRPMALPRIARFKLANARKFGLNVYWLTQHEGRVSTVVRSLTNYIYLCTSWLWLPCRYSTEKPRAVHPTVFSLKGYEPENMMRARTLAGKNSHVHRVIRRFRHTYADLYDTLEILAIDTTEHTQGMEHITEIRHRRNRRNALPPPTLDIPAAPPIELDTEGEWIE